MCDEVKKVLDGGNGKKSFENLIRRLRQIRESICRLRLCQIL